VGEELSIPSRGYLEVRFTVYALPDVLLQYSISNTTLGDEPGGALRLILFVYQCLKRNSFTIASSAGLTCLGLPSSTANTY
jgi:hypothetical protein